MAVSILLLFFAGQAKSGGELVELEKLSNLSNNGEKLFIANTGKCVIFLNENGDVKYKQPTYPAPTYQGQTCKNSDSRIVVGKLDLYEDVRTEIGATIPKYALTWAAIDALRHKEISVKEAYLMDRVTIDGNSDINLTDEIANFLIESRGIDTSSIDLATLEFVSDARTRRAEFEAKYDELYQKNIIEGHSILFWFTWARLIFQTLTTPGDSEIRTPPEYYHPRVEPIPTTAPIVDPDADKPQFRYPLGQ